ncbi:MAG: RagB/SusD family nutrient uptake outer membrane protein, partial [Alistipes sp.]|nr:RagB/SusD family nutrient uptake outer membrane protein [Alistipes sp.]
MKRFIILTVVLTAGLTGCDLLDTKPLSQISQTDYFKNETDLQLFSNPFYNNLLDKNPYDDQSDLIVCQTLSNEMLGGNKRTVPASGGGWTWTDLRRMNTLLEYSSQCPDEDVVTKYNALTRFFRAVCYFEKVKRFGDVPWYDVQLGSADEALYKPRDSRELIMTKMIEDVNFAINELTSDVSTYRVNRWAALALKAQFCLYEGTYRKYHNVNLEGHDYAYYLDLAAKAAKELIDDGPYKLYKTGNPEKDYLTLFAQENASQDEYILAIKFDYGLGIYHNATALTLVPTQGRPGYTRKFINMYLMK